MWSVGFDLKMTFSIRSKKRRMLALCITASALLLLPFCSQAFSGYDKYIKAYWSMYNPEVHWGIGWAQIKQESSFNCSAVSSAGAMGCAQFMPGTWRDMIKAGIVPENASPFDVKYALEAQAYYMRTQFNGWDREIRSHVSWVNLSLAGYNAGRGHLYAAQRACHGAIEYEDIVECLPDITGHHHKETIDYVQKINQYKVERFGF